MPSCTLFAACFVVAQCRLVLSDSVCLICLLVLAASCTVDVPNHSRALFKVSALSVHSKVFGYPNSTFSITLNGSSVGLSQYNALHYIFTLQHPPQPNIATCNSVCISYCSDQETLMLLRQECVHAYVA